jgi:hypothetical protein
MLEHIRKIPLVRRSARAIYREYRDWNTGRQWRRAGRPLPPPPHIKRKFLRAYGHAHKLRLFVETGTYVGDTLAALRGSFAHLHSIELSRELHEAALARFKGDPKITLWHGDSGDVLPSLLALLDTPTLFWLDGHYSGGTTARGVEDTPIMRELRHISRHPLSRQHHLIIDDARLFTGSDGYPDISDVETAAKCLGFASCRRDGDFLIVSP